MEDRLRVLMFEAAAGDGDPAVEMLQRAGVQFGLRRVATAADAATQICRFNPQLAVAVLTRPDANGCAVLQAMHAKRPDVPVIILSATRSAEHVVQMLKAGATDYVLSDNLERLPSAMLNAVQEAEERVRRAAKVARLECVRAIQSRISSAVLRIHDPQELLQEACRIAQEEGGFPLVWAAQLSHAPLRADLVATGGRDKRHFALAAPLSDLEVQENGLVARAVLTRRPAVVDDFVTADHFALGKSPSDHGYRSAIALPLVSGETVSAVVVLYATEPQYFDVTEVKLLSELAADVSFALDYIVREKKLAELAYHDVLTGLANRQLLHEHLKQALALAHRLRRVVALVFIDLDHFKSVNDTLGHAAGDSLLKEVAARLAACTREGDIVARYGGDEFVMVLPNLSTDDAAAPLIKRILKSVAQPLALGAETVHLTCSVGIALYPRDGVDIATLVMKADSAMYQVKRRGRAAFLFHQEEPQARLLHRGAA